jgi:hypothetical protein
MRDNPIKLQLQSGQLTAPRIFLTFLVVAIAAFAFTFQSFGQIPVPLNAGLAMHPNSDGTYTIEMHALREDSHWIPKVGAQFSGIYQASSIQTLPNGAHVTQRGAYERLYRDFEGRVRRDQLLTSTGDESTGIFIVQLFDPIAGFQYILDDQNHVAHRAPFKSEKPRQPSPTVSGYTAETDPSGHRPEPYTTHEYFKDQTMEGVPVVGRRGTSNYPTGFQGSGVPFIVVNEEWMSAELDMKILDKRTDSRGTERTWRMTNISRAAPDPSLFRVPEGYSIVDEPGGFVMTLKRRH